MNDEIEPDHLQLMREAGLIVTDDQPAPKDLPSTLEGWKAVTNLGNIPLYKLTTKSPPRNTCPK